MLCTAATELGVSALEGSVAPIGRGEHVVEGDRNGAVTATTRTPKQQSGTVPATAWAGLTPVSMACHLEAVRRNGSLERDRTVLRPTAVHQGGESGAARPVNAFLCGKAQRH